MSLLLLALLLYTSTWPIDVVAAELQQSTDLPLSLTPAFSPNTSLKPDDRLELILSRELKRPETRVAVFFGSTDVSHLFKFDKKRLRYDSRIWPMPLGEVQLSAYVVTPDENWKEIARFSFTVAKETSPVDERTDGPKFLRAGFFDRSPLPEPLPMQNDSGANNSGKKGAWKFLPSLNIGLKTQPAQTTFPDSSSMQIGSPFRWPCPI